MIGLDTAIFIFHFEENQKYLKITSAILGAIEEGKVKGVTSIITLMEILAKPKAENNQTAVEEYKFVLNTFPNLKVLNIDTRIAEKAAELKARYGITSRDAIQAATSILNGADTFITNDPNLRKVEEIKVLTLDEMLEL